MSVVIVFSHLRWNFVHQRPQHLLSRLARFYPVIFLEEPVFDAEHTFLERVTPVPNVMVCRPHTPIAATGFHDEQLPLLRELIRQLMMDFNDHIVWFTTPMAVPLLPEIHPRLVIYDCMDMPAARKSAPQPLREYESTLFTVADLVFAAGLGLYRTQRAHHPHVHYFPDSVDGSHFLQALDRTNAHPAHRSIAGPRLGYYGVIDERVDAHLIAHLADAHPQWQVVLAGPIGMRDAATLPHRANIHYLGYQPYSALPRLLAGWDVCLLPFVAEEATQFVSTTRILEYMAAELPIVSTHNQDVVDLYDGIVSSAETPAAFVSACEAALLASAGEHAARAAKMRAVVSSTSWDATVASMHALIEQAARNSGNRVSPRLRIRDLAVQSDFQCKSISM